jgi:SAM-dependent methyltransferase
VKFLGGKIGYHILKMISRGGTGPGDNEAPTTRQKLELHFGSSIWEDIRGKTVIDFGCGRGDESVEIASHGAEKVIGIEIQDRFLSLATQRAEAVGVSHKCTFTKDTDEKADVVISLDSFEHFDDPSAVLKKMRELLGPAGEVWISFGWPWYHPRGGHLFSIFPWAHLIFTESSLIRWRSDFKTDGATRFSEVDGGLNQMSIRRFEKTIEASPLCIDQLRLRPIRAFRWFHCSPTREFTTAVVQARLRASNRK